MVPLTQRNLWTSAAHIAATLDLTGKDLCLNMMPLFHIHGLVGACFRPWRPGERACTSAFDAEKFFPWLRELRPTWYTAVPAIHQAVLSCARADGKTRRHYPLRFIRSSSAALPQGVMEELEEVFHVPVIEAYGMTEAAHQIASNPLPPGIRKPRSVGLPAGAEVAVMDEEGRPLPRGSIGEVAIRGASIASATGTIQRPTKKVLNTAGSGRETRGIWMKRLSFHHGPPQRNGQQGGRKDFPARSRRGFTEPSGNRPSGSVRLCRIRLWAKMSPQRWSCEIKRRPRKPRSGNIFPVGWPNSKSPPGFDS